MNSNVESRSSCCRWKVRSQYQAIRPNTAPETPVADVEPISRPMMRVSDPHLKSGFLSKIRTVGRAMARNGAMLFL